MNEEKQVVVASPDYDRAVRLTKRIAANAHAMQESLYEVCKGLKEMRDNKLYKELGYERFEEYAENEVGIRRSMAYNYITVAEKLPSEFVHSSGQIGIKKLGLLAMLDPADREEIQQTVDVEQTSVRELRAEIENLKTAKKQAEQEAKEATEKAETKAMEAAAARMNSQRLADQVQELEGQIKELEDRPVDVAVSVEAEEEAKRLKSELEETTIKMAVMKSNHKSEMDAEMQKHVQELDSLREANDREIAELREEYEDKIAKAAQPDSKATFKAYLANAIDSATRLTGFVNSHKSDPEYEFFRGKVTEMLESIRNTVK